MKMEKASKPSRPVSSWTGMTAQNTKQSSQQEFSSPKRVSQAVQNKSKMKTNLALPANF